MKDFGYNKEEVRLFRKLNSPQKIQDYLNSIPFNFEEKGETCMSPRVAIRKNKVHCMEGAMLAAAILEFHGYKPLVVDLRSIKKPHDDDHIIAVFKKFGCFGAISKTNHPVLRYREPVYKTLRELVMSYFHEYYLVNGLKTLREYTDPFDLNYFNKLEWRTSEKDLLDIPHHLDKIKHYKILTPTQEKNLRKVDEIEVDAGDLEEYSKK